MRKAAILGLALALVIPAFALAQGAPKEAAQNRTGKPRTIAALVSADGTSLLDAKQNHWTVGNPEALSAFQNQRVKVKYLVSIEKNQVQVISVKPLPAATTNTAYKTDSAYRR